MQHKPITAVFVKICKAAPVVIACRVSPKQKAEIVTLMRNNDSEAVTLAIGDGANDVNMITAAHVGVGIRGVEGQQAARASDYAITQFKHLKNLLFVHGREATRRNSYTICYCFYKNALLVAPNVMYESRGNMGRFAFFSAGSAQALYNEWLYQLYNTIFTTVPIVYYAVLDKEFEREDFLQEPRLFEPARNSSYFNYSVFWRWMWYGLLQGLMLLLGVLLTLSNNPSSSNGVPEDMYFVGNMVFTLVVIVANLKILASHNTHTFGSTFFIFGTIAVYYLCYYLLSLMKSQSIYGSFTRLFFNWVHVFLQLLLIVAVMLMEIVVHQGKRFFLMYFGRITGQTTVKRSFIGDSESLARSIGGECNRACVDTGFAFSQEAGHTPQITSAEFRLHTDKSP